MESKYRTNIKSKYLWRRPRLYKKQYDAFFNPYRYSVCEASTKAGKTHGALLWLLEMAFLHGRSNHVFWWVAPVSSQAKISFNRAKLAVKNFIVRVSEVDSKMVLINGAIIFFKSGEKPDNLYGEDVQACVIDEASRLREESWIAVRSTLTATRGKIRIIGNVKGKGNWFDRIARKAEQKQPDHFYSKITAYDAIDGGVLNPQEIEDARLNLPERVFKELYLAEPADDGGNPFGLENIMQCVSSLSKNKSVVYGIDLAKYKDYTVIIGLDRNCRVSYFNRFQKSWKIQSQIIENVCNAPTLVDSTGVGDSIVENLQDKKPNIFTGYLFSNSSKQKLMELLELKIQKKEIFFPDNEIKKELDVFEYKLTRNSITYSAPETLHDDCVIALSLALKHYTEHYKYINYEPKIAYV